MLRQPTHLQEGEVHPVSRVFISIKQLLCSCFHILQEGFLRWTRPPNTSLLLGTLADLARGKSELVAENALLRQQLIILRRQSKQPACTKRDRILLVLLAKVVRAWRQALLIVQPETLLRWHRQGLRLFWKQKSKTTSTQAKVAAETIALIKQMARNNRLWGAERIRGELLKLDIRVGKRTVQKYMRRVRPPRSSGTSGIKVLKTPYHTPRANAICERFLGSVRRECLDHVLILSEKQLHRILLAYVEYFNRARPHQGIRQQVPQGEVTSVPPDQRSNRIISIPVLGGLHHEYRKVA